MDREIGSRRRISHAVCALACAIGSAAPGTAGASSGGAGLTGAAGPAAAGDTGSAPVPGDGATSVSATGDGVTIEAQAATLLSRGLTFTGIAPSNSADTVVIERRGSQTQWRWVPTASTTVASDASFTATWNANHTGRFAIRAIVSTPGLAQAATVTPTVTVTVYRPSRATQYGPGFYGRRTACGVRLTRATIGIASPTVACGTEVALLYGGRTLVVPVIDRGPYANHAGWDLTVATARVLGISGTVQIGAVPLPSTS